MIFRRDAGEAVVIDVRTRDSRSSKSQLLALKYEDWRIFHEVHKRPTWMIAHQYGVDESQVRRGIRQAKRLREAVTDAIETSAIAEAG